MTTALAFLGVVVLHAAWLGVAAAAVAAIALRRLGAARPRSRYSVALAALLAVPPAAVLCAVSPRVAAETAAVAVSSAVADAGTTYSLAPATPWIGLAWVIGVAWGLLALVVASARLESLRRGARPVPAAVAERYLARARAQLGHAGAIELAISTRVGVPTLLGWRRPLCALPASAFTAWPGDDLEWLLVHELAHVRRADVAWNWAQSLVEVALFFHPAARWLARQIRHERECCCDAAVIARPDALTPYVRALTRLAAADRSAIRPALSATGGTLVSRVERLIDPTTPIPTCSRGLCVALVLGAWTGAAALSACKTEADECPPERAIEDSVQVAVVEPVAAVEPTAPKLTQAVGSESAVPAHSEERPAEPPVVKQRPEVPIPFLDPPETDGEGGEGC
ncbi:M56 family metallopeptidase [Nannocystis sp. SCPEA4]|uniref:M56 family metallopeptidase n=1 Tax=Nannocystis sp. SCPEA4 TaxID=2996787 RepID=UPI00226EB375|nr:M56 family metallopeptidase [Nannocystis sp. SCPEA4]MCY1054804.1 M56 family metallopeptidase [Nannocystis sp. SCPEA4]